jgi:DegV family protein with EDD domain
MGLGFAVIAAAEAASSGAAADEVVAAASSTAAATTTLFYVDTLEHLRRGGRIGAAAALFGTALAVKPLLHVVDGHIAPLEKVRTASKALARLEDIAAGIAGDAPVDIAVHHLAAADKATALADRLRGRVPGLSSMHVSEVGAVVGAHVGPGLLGVVVSRR